ncbi:MAG: PQQ-dependent sugar dehydrogenase [Micromonosporaceae bacterium]
MRRRRVSIGIVAAAVMALVASGSAGAATNAPEAAATRYEAENAVCQGTVDSDHAGFSGTGFCNTTNAVGSYVEWTVTVAMAGTATLAFRQANGTTANRPMDITVNGSAARTGVAFNSTGAWSTWETVTTTASLPAGSVKIRATATTSGGAPNLDYLEVEVAAPSNDYQAEDATISQGTVDSDHAGFTGTGFVNYTNVAGSYVEFTVSAAAAGPASLTFRHANGTTANRPMEIRVNGTVVSANLAFNPTDAWSTWEGVSVNATLVAGANTVRATATGSAGGPNLDRLRVGAPADSENPTTPGAPTCPADQIGETNVHLHWGASSDNVAVVAYDIYHDGNKLSEATGAQTDKDLTGLTPNTEYRLTVFARDAAGNVSDSSASVTCKTKASTDTTPPSAPTNLTHSNVAQTTVDMSWGASTDNRGVTAYDIRNSSNAVLHTVTGNPPATSTRVTGLTCNTSYTLHVVARDLAGNVSAPSNSRTFTTTSCSRGTPQTPTTVSTGWTIPWAISWLPDGQSALITERDHFRVWRVTLSGQKTLIGTVPNSQTTGGEGGLMGVAVSPTWNGTTDQDVFFMHTSTDNNRIVKMSFNGSSLSGYTVLVNGIRKNRFHNGGRLKFGPDGFLYASTGDAQQSSLAQDRNSLNGKILRVTRTGAAAPGNPFGTRIYSYGHRNPQGLAWDSAGRLWSSELGQSSVDELNLILPGRNYGWPTCEGSCNVAGMENPKKTFSVSSCSPSGIAIVNDTVYMTALRGERLWRIELNGTSAGATSSYFVGTYGRLRAIATVPGVNAIWFGTTNADNNGGEPDGSDRIRRSEIR